MLALAAGLGAATLAGAAPPNGGAADAQALTTESAAGRGTNDRAGRGKRPQDQAAPADKAPAAKTPAGKTPTGKASAPASAAPAPAASPSAAAPAAPPAPAQLDLDYQFAWQENFYFCGPAATRIALTARGLFPSQTQVAQSLGTTVNGTNSSQDTVRALNAYTGGGFYSAHFIRGQAATPEDVEALRLAVVNAIGHGYAVVANIAGSTMDDGGHAHSYSGGHYLTIVGYRDGGATVKIADPADALGVGSYTLSVKKMADWIALRGYAA
jgi:hypothetical protein